MREPHCRRGQDCSDASGLPVSGRPWTTADGRDRNFEAEPDSSPWRRTPARQTAVRIKPPTLPGEHCKVGDTRVTAPSETVENHIWPTPDHLARACSSSSRRDTSRLIASAVASRSTSPPTWDRTGPGMRRAAVASHGRRGVCASSIVRRRTGPRPSRRLHRGMALLARCRSRRGHGGCREKWPSAGTWIPKPRRSATSPSRQ